MHKYLIIAIIVLSGALYLMYSSYAHVRADRDRLKSNQEQLLSTSSEGAKSVRQLELKVAELSDSRTELTHTIEELNIKLKRVISTSTTITKANAEISTQLRDTTIIRDTIPIVMPGVNWSDEYFALKGHIDNDKLIGMVSYTDTLLQVLHRVPHKFLFFRWGCKEVRQEARLANPNAKILYQEVIKLR